MFLDELGPTCRRFLFQHFFKDWIWTNGWGMDVKAILSNAFSNQKIWLKYLHRWRKTLENWWKLMKLKQKNHKNHKNFSSFAETFLRAETRVFSHQDIIVITGLFTYDLHDSISIKLRQIEVRTRHLWTRRIAQGWVLSPIVVKS